MSTSTRLADVRGRTIMLSEQGTPYVLNNGRRQYRPQARFLRLDDEEEVTSRRRPDERLMVAALTVLRELPEDLRRRVVREAF